MADKSWDRVSIRSAGPAAGRPGFTLLEALAVIAAILVLCAVLLPSLSRSRQAAKQTLCQVNLSHIGKAWQMYLLDSRGLFPQTIVAQDNMEINFGGRQGTAGPPFIGAKVLNPYLAFESTTLDAPVFSCPLDTGAADAEPTCYDWYGSSYQMNQFLVGIANLPYPTANPYGSLFKRMKDDHVKRVRVGFVWVTQVTVSEDQLAEPATRIPYAGDYGWRRRLDPLLDKSKLVDWNQPADCYNLVFRDGHARSTQVIKGKYITEKCLAIPFKNLQKELLERTRQQQ